MQANYAFSGFFERRLGFRRDTPSGAGWRLQGIGRGGRGPRSGGEDSFGRSGGGSGDGSSRGGRGGRVFEHGAIKLLTLALVAERPCYGYELIKQIEALVGGDYSPSPGVIYPTLTYLVDMGWATVQDGDGGRKQYTITPDGQAQLTQQSTELAGLKARLQQVKDRMAARRSPDIERAMCNLKAVLNLRLSDGTGSAELTRRISTVIDEAALTIQKLEV